MSLAQERTRELAEIRAWERRARLVSRLDPWRGYPVLRKLFRQHNGYDLDLRSPQSFNEKINWRKLNDRNPLYPTLVDKVRVRDWIRTRLGDEAEALFLPLHGVWTDPADVPFDQLPDTIVYKANHGADFNVIRRADQPFDPEAARHVLTGHLLRRYGLREQEWAYWSVPRRILAEELLCHHDGRLAHDLKFVMFHGTCAYIQMGLDRGTANQRQVMLDLDWQILPFLNKDLPPPPHPPEPPELGRMLDIAIKLARGFDHMRVDFLVTERDAAFSEITLYRGSGFTPFRPRNWDLDLGALWSLPGQPRVAKSADLG